MHFGGGGGEGTSHVRRPQVTIRSREEQKEEKEQSTN